MLPGTVRIFLALGVSSHRRVTLFMATCRLRLQALILPRPPAPRSQRSATRTPSPSTKTPCKATGVHGFRFIIATLLGLTVFTDVQLANAGSHHLQTSIPRSRLPLIIFWGIRIMLAARPFHRHASLLRLIPRGKQGVKITMEAPRAPPCQPGRPCPPLRLPTTDDYALWAGPLDKGCVAALVINTGDKDTVKRKIRAPFLSKVHVSNTT